MAVPRLTASKCGTHEPTPPILEYVIVKVYATRDFHEQPCAVPVLELLTLTARLLVRAGTRQVWQSVGTHCKTGGS
jgi:hypothetical protein